MSHSVSVSTATRSPRKIRLLSEIRFPTPLRRRAPRRVLQWIRYIYCYSTLRAARLVKSSLYFLKLRSPIGYLTCLLVQLQQQQRVSAQTFCAMRDGANG